MQTRRRCRRLGTIDGRGCWQMVSSLPAGDDNETVTQPAINNWGETSWPTGLRNIGGSVRTRASSSDVGVLKVMGCQWMEGVHNKKRLERATTWGLRRQGRCLRIRIYGHLANGLSVVENGVPGSPRSANSVRCNWPVMLRDICCKCNFVPLK